MAGVRKLRRSVKYQSELRKLVRSAKGQKIFFTDSMQKLLNAAIPSSEIPDDCSMELWSEPIGERVREYLGKERYEYFEETVGEIESCLLNLAAELARVQGSSRVWPWCFSVGISF